MATIKEALKYPFGNFARLFNVYWALIPIWGWFVLYGYLVRMIDSILTGNKEEAPAIRPFTGLFSTGFFLVVISFALGILASVLMMIPYIGWIFYLYLVLVIPIMILQFAESKKFADGFNFIRATKTVFGNFGEYIVTWLKIIVVVLVWAVASIPVITIIITLPAMWYGQYVLLTDFYKQATANQTVSVPKKAVKGSSKKSKK